MAQDLGINFSTICCFTVSMSGSSQVLSKNGFSGP